MFWCSINSVWPESPFNFNSLSFWLVPSLSTLLLSGTIKCEFLLCFASPRVISRGTLPTPRHRQRYKEAKVWVVSVLIATGYHCSELGDVCANHNAQLYLWLLVYLFTCIENHRFTLIPPILVQHNKIHCGFLPFHICKNIFFDSD